MSTATVDTSTTNQRVLRLLSTIPYFDLETGADIAVFAEDALADNARRSWADGFMFELASSGLLERVHSLHRVHDELRDVEAGLAIASDRENVNRALNVFVDRANDSLKKPLAAVLGPRGSLVLVRSLKAASNPDSQEAFDALIDTVHRSARVGRKHDASAAAKILQPYTAEADRRLTFLRALSYWQTDDQASAAKLFNAVIKDHAKDKAAGISYHLLGVFEHRQGRSDEAKRLLRKAEEILRTIGDLRGLAITRTSYAQVLRETASDELGLERSMKMYGKAREALNRDTMINAEERRRSEGRILLGEGQVLFRLGQRVEGLKLVTDSLEALGPNPDQELWVRVVLASLYRDNDDAARGLDVLADAVDARFATGRRDFQVAQALNILASVERRLPQHLQSAWRHAIQSVNVGEKIGNYRHLTHASQTLAEIELDRLIQNQMATSSDIRQIKQGLYKAQVWAAKLNDPSDLEHIRDLIEEVDKVAHSRGLVTS